MTADEVPHCDPTSFTPTPSVDGPEGIRAFNRHRHEMELLDGVCAIDTSRHFVVGYTVAEEGDFWVRGHMPSFPLMPGVLMCEAAAQLCSYYVGKTGVIKDTLMGLGGIEGAKFKRMVKPGETLLLIGHGLRVDRRITRFHTRGYVGSEFAFECVIVGVQIKAGGGA